MAGLVAGADSPWIGLTDAPAESAFVWQVAPGQFLAPAYLKWGPGQPDDKNGTADCVVIDPKNALWSDEVCGDPRGYICEHEW